MKLLIPPLSQRDIRWKDKRMGGDGSLGLYGCLVTCWSMMAIYYGHEDMLPDTLNQVFKDKGCYDGNYLNFYKAGDLFPDINCDEYYECNDIPCDLSKIDRYLDKKMPVIAKVDFDMNPSTKGDWHFVIIIGKDEQNNYFINDPWTGETYYFHAKYDDPARNIYGLRLYTGTPKNGESLEDKIADLQTKLSSSEKALAEKILEADQYRKDLETQERENSDLANQLAEARGQKYSAVWEKERVEASNEKLKADVENRDGKIEALNLQISSLQEQIKELKKQTASDLTKWELLKLTISKFFEKRG